MLLWSNREETFAAVVAGLPFEKSEGMASAFTE